MTASERFWEKVERSDGCWIWQAGKTNAGYGAFHPETGSTVLAHRFAYEELIGPIPEGLTLDHLCRERICVNPEHLEPVTRGENVRRGEAPNIVRHRTGICARGHDLLEHASRKKNGMVAYCRACRREKRKEIAA